MWFSNHLIFLKKLINDNHWLDYLKSFLNIQYSLDSFEFSKCSIIIKNNVKFYSKLSTLIEIII
jgi:hypothetical protein